jgi:hypothetical protein
MPCVSFTNKGFTPPASKKPAQNRVRAAGKKECPAAFRGGRAFQSENLSRLFQVCGKRDNLSALLEGYPFHFRFETRWNVKLDHLRHNHPPIQDSSSVYLNRHAGGCSVTKLDAKNSVKVAGFFFPPGRNFRRVKMFARGGKKNYRLKFGLTFQQAS